MDNFDDHEWEDDPFDPRDEAGWFPVLRSVGNRAPQRPQPTVIILHNRDNLWDSFGIDESKFDYRNYDFDEERLIKPALERKGFHHVRFAMGERDSFGPLSRLVYAERDDKLHRWVYG